MSYQQKQYQKSEDDVSESYSQNGHQKAKAFQINPAPRDIGQDIKDARHVVTHDPDLSHGAVRLFVILLDKAASAATYYGFGSALISVTKLCEAMNCSARAVYGWKKQLIAKRYIWLTQQPMPNFWPMDVYHITALNAPDRPSQMPTRDGFWGNGTRRTMPEPGQGARAPGQGALGLRGTKVHRIKKGAHSENPSVLAEIAPESGTNGHAPAANNATGSRKNCQGEPQSLRRGAVNSAAGSGKTGHLPAAQKDTGQPLKPAHIIKPLVSSIELSESKVEGVQAPAPESELDRTIRTWRKSLDGRYASALEKMRVRFQEQRKKVSKAGRALLERKLAILDEVIEGPQPEWAEPKKPARAEPKPNAEKPMSPEEILAGAQYLAAVGKPHLMSKGQRTALARHHKANGL